MSPLVSIWMISYNHEDYISTSIDSILNQNVNFDFEIIIGDDASIDSTQKIILEYQKKHPNIIVALLNEENIGMMKNMLSTLKRCRGKYIAFCEGDDYWIDSNKLQNQVQFMEQTPSCTLCFTNRIEISSNGELIKETNYEQRKYSTFDILKGFIPPTQTILIKNIPGLTNFLSTQLNSPSGDRLLTYYCSLMGDIYLLPIYSAVYRHSGKGVWNKFNFDTQFLISIERLIQFHLSIGIPVNNEIIHQRLNGSIIYLIRKDLTKSIKSIIKVLKLKKKYRIKSHFIYYLISKIF